MPKTKRKPASYRTISIKEDIVQRIENFIHKNRTYHSIAEFTAEALRLRLENLESKGENK
jgi:hypothetical protein